MFHGQLLEIYAGATRRAELQRVEHIEAVAGRASWAIASFAAKGRASPNRK
jgi:hypothetical protein